MADGPPGERHGHIKISRKAYESDPFWLERREFSRWEAWEYMIQAASFKPTRWTAGGPVVRLARGETPPLSLSYLCRAWGWSTKKVRVFLDLLISEERVRKGKDTPQGHTYILVNYATYQGSGAKPGHKQGTARAQLGQESEAVKQLSNTVGELWDVWVDELGGKQPHPSLSTGKRRQVLTALYEEQLQRQPDPVAVFRQVCRAVKRSDHHMSQRDYHMPESLFLNSERREKWTLKALNPQPVQQSRNGTTNTSGSPYIPGL
jgi:hypothetical protein